MLTTLPLVPLPPEFSDLPTTMLSLVLRRKIDYYETAMKKIGGRRQGGGTQLV